MARVSAATSRHEAEVGFREAADVGEDDGDVPRQHAEPRRERGAVFVDARRGNPAAAADVVVGADGDEIKRLAKEDFPGDCSRHRLHNFHRFDAHIKYSNFISG